jgi:pSer/pThr/pTyr-binding forkhead associated (FHA) protein
VALPEGSLLVGRGPEASGLRLEERNVSRRHARFVRAGALVLVEDLASRNGTYVNGARVEGRCRLQPGDRVAIGDFEILVEEAEGAAAPDGRPAGAETVELPPPLPQRYTSRPGGTGGGPGEPSALRRLAGVARAALAAVSRVRRG